MYDHEGTQKGHTSLYLSWDPENGSHSIILLDVLFQRTENMQIELLQGPLRMGVGETRKYKHLLGID